MNLNKKIHVKNFELCYSELRLGSIIFLNILELKNVKLNLTNLNWNNNQYDSNIHFIYFRKLTTENLIVDI